MRDNRSNQINITCHGAIRATKTRKVGWGIREVRSIDGLCSEYNRGSESVLHQPGEWGEASQERKHVGLN